MGVPLSVLFTEFKNEERRIRLQIDSDVITHLISITILCSLIPAFQLSTFTCMMHNYWDYWNANSPPNSKCYLCIILASTSPVLFFSCLIPSDTINYPSKMCMVWAWCNGSSVCHQGPLLQDLGTYSSSYTSNAWSRQEYEVPASGFGLRFNMDLKSHTSFPAPCGVCWSLSRNWVIV